VEIAEDFCGETFAVLDINRHVVPPGPGLEQALRDQRALAVVRSVLQELEPLVDRLRDTEMALGNDMLDAALEGYRVLKHVGRSHGLDGLVSEFGARFVHRVRRQLAVASAHDIA
jgi:hypothetical protein